MTAGTRRARPRPEANGGASLAGIRDPPKADPEEPRILRVRVPLRQHLALHDRRLRHGEGLSEAVTAALEAYLARRGRPA